MTINELLEILQSEVECGNGDKEVRIACDYGDYTHTAQSLEIEDTLYGKEERGAYSHSGYEAWGVEDEADADIFFIKARDESELREADKDDEEEE